MNAELLRKFSEAAKDGTPISLSAEEQAELMPTAIKLPNRAYRRGLKARTKPFWRRRANR